MDFKYRADQVGSLLRPPQLLAARKDPTVPPERLKEIEDHHILHALERQRDLGFQIFTDGELRRRGFMSDFHESVEGLEGEGEIARAWNSSEGTRQPGSVRASGVVVGKVRQKRRLARDEAAFLKRHAPGDIKMTLPTANQFPAIAYKKGVSERAYPSYSEFLWDIAPIVQSEIRALAAEGVPYIQIDAPRYSYYIDPHWRRYVQQDMGVDPEQALEEAIRVDNFCLAGAPRDGVIYAMHLCRGNNRSQWYAEGGYDPIAEKLFHQLNVSVFLLEYDSDRAGTFEALRFLPKDKVAVLGLVSSKVPEPESRQRIIARIQQASRYLPLENLALSPQCGFASTFEGNLLTEDQQWRKLELVAEIAREVWR